MSCSSKNNEQLALHLGRVQTQWCQVVESLQISPPQVGGRLEVGVYPGRKGCWTVDFSHAKVQAYIDSITTGDLQVCTCLFSQGIMGNIDSTGLIKVQAAVASE